LAISLTIISTALTVVGILFQVAAALLAKPPSDPGEIKGDEESKDLARDLALIAAKSLHNMATQLTLSIAIPVKIPTVQCVLAPRWYGHQWRAMAPRNLCNSC
jgi:hypothetical protein